MNLPARTMTLERDAEPLAAERSDAYWRKDARQGSRALLEAIHRAAGQPVPEIKAIEVPIKGQPTRMVNVCEHCGSPLSGSRVLVATIQAEVAAYYDLPLVQMSSDKRTSYIARARQVAMFLAYEMTPKSLPEIGRRFRKDHTTVIHAIRAVKQRIETDPEVAADVALLRSKLEPEVGLLG